VLTHSLGAIAYVLVIVSATLSNFDRRLELAAKSMRAGPLQTFWRVTLPLIRPGIIGGALFAFLHSFDEVVKSSLVSGFSIRTLPLKMWENIRNEAGAVSERRPPPRRFKLSYLVTAWTQRPEDEHRLLSALLSCFLRHPTMPTDALAGALAQARMPILLNIALPPPQDRSISDVWSALGGELKPSLDLIVNAPFEVKIAVPAGPPVLEEPKFSFSSPDGEAEGAAAAGARGGKGKRLTPAAAAAAKPVGAAGPGGPKPFGRLKPGEPVDKPGIAADQEELVRSGKEKQPGRILRIRGVNRS